jgi:DnaJ-class molecular chaperone
MEDILSFAKKMSDDMPEADKKKLQSMDINKMLAGVMGGIQDGKDPMEALSGFGDIMKSMQDPSGGGDMSSIFENIMKSMQGGMPSMDPIVNDNSRLGDKADNRFEDILEENSEEDSDGDDIVQKSRDLNYNLNVKLEDLYNGKQKKISFNRKRYKKENDSVSTFTEKKKIVINIVPGMRDGDIITFAGEADHLPDQTAGDVIITICEDEHDVFDREGDNLFLVKDLSLSELYSLDFTVTHMDGRVLHIVSKEDDVLHTNDGIRKVIGEGMPIKSDCPPEDVVNGDLFIRFNLILPDRLSSEQIEILKDITPPINEKTDADGMIESRLDIVSKEDIEKLDESDYDSSDEDEYASSENDDE